MKLRAGDWVEVRSKEEILLSLDDKGRLDELPFMPEMFQYCGQRFRVYRRAHKTCDTVNRTGGRSISNAVHLELRCDGKAHQGCQAACLLFWKNAWLKPVKLGGQTEGPVSGGAGIEQDPATRAAHCTESDVWNGTQCAVSSADDATRFVCQATELPHITSFLPWWNMKQYIEDFTSGNVTLGRLFCGMMYACYWELLERAGDKGGRALVWLYDGWQRLWGGIPFPRKTGMIAAGQSTPTVALNLQPGERVRVKPYSEILATLNTEGKNRGLSFDGEQVPYCGGVYRVQSRVSKFIDERTGKMKSMKQDAIILEGVWCQARYSNCRMLCPRSIYSWWREIWLERVPEGSDRIV